MRRAALLALPALLALVPAAPSQAGSGVCVSSSGVTACPTAVSRCNTFDVITVRVTGGQGSGAASCGGTTASCYVIRFTCTATARTAGAGILTCTATGPVVAVCEVSIAVNS